MVEKIEQSRAMITGTLVGQGATHMSRARAKRIANQVLWRILTLPFLCRFQTRLYHTNCYVVEGRTKGSGCELRSLVFGDSQALHYLIDLVYSDLYQIKSTSRTKLEKVNSVSEEVAPDVVFAEFSSVLSDVMSKRFLILPSLTWSIDITQSMEIMISKMKRLRRRCIRTIQETEYTYEYTNSAEKFDFFYNNMYVPYISKTHGESTRLTSAEVAKKIFQRGGLYLMKSEGAYVSGILFSRKNKSLQCVLLAINPETGSEIAGQAALLGLIKYAKEEGFTEIDYGISPPFADGLFWYKRTWGMQVKPLSYRAFGIHLHKISDGVLDFLANNPLLFTCYSDLAILVLLNIRDIDPRALHRRFYTPGLMRLVAIHQGTNRQVSGMSSLDNSLEQLLATLLPFQELRKNGYCAHVLTFDQTNIE